MTQQNNSTSSLTKPKQSSGSSSSSSTASLEAAQQAGGSVTVSNDSEIVIWTPELGEASFRFAEVMKRRREQDKETEVDGLRAEALRRLQVQHIFKARQAQPPESSVSPSGTPSITGSTTSNNKQNTFN
jgi:hypothetical protein